MSLNPGANIKRLIYYSFFIMRNLLRPYLGAYVHCMGWIVAWDNNDKINTRRICVSNVTVAKPDRMLTFEKQEVIGKLDHLNIFCNKSENPPNDSERYHKIAFSGTVIQYTRKDGSTDYGIHQVCQTPFNEMLDMVENDLLSLATRPGNKAENYFRFIETIDFLHSTEYAIDSLGDYLPTFDYNYHDYKVRIGELLSGLHFAVQRIKVICGNRQMRRSCKISRKLANAILA
jgi:hypothetical protein